VEEGWFGAKELFGNKKEKELYIFKDSLIYLT
jgi:hypothetical protein